MSKITNGLIERFGTDKVLHFLGGAWITALFGVLGWWGLIASFVAVFVLSYIKEEFLDDTFDKVDIQAALIGSAASAVVYSVIRLIYSLFT